MLFANLKVESFRRSFNGGLEERNGLHHWKPFENRLFSFKNSSTDNWKIAMETNWIVLCFIVELFVFRNSNTDASENFIRSRSISEPDINFGVFVKQLRSKSYLIVRFRSQINQPSTQTDLNRRISPSSTLPSMICTITVEGSHVIVTRV